MNNYQKPWLFLLVLSGILLFQSCGRQGMAANEGVQVNLDRQIELISSKKVFFGHQSVGYNIVVGINELLGGADSGIIRIVETSSVKDFGAPVFAHSAIGRNKEPLTKMDGFKKTMDSGVGNRVEIAFFKLCYIDISAETDTKALFAHYAKVMAYLESKFPKVRFIHFTVPLREVIGGPKAGFKRILGLNVWGDEDNIKRTEYNEMMRNKFASTGRLFDLARYEAEYAGGKSSGFKLRGKIYPSLAHIYTDDGGHLNKTGREVVARRLLE